MSPDLRRTTKIEDAPRKVHRPIARTRNSSVQKLRHGRPTSSPVAHGSQGNEQQIEGNDGACDMLLYNTLDHKATRSSAYYINRMWPPQWDGNGWGYRFGTTRDHAIHSQNQVLHRTSWKYSHHWSMNSSQCPERLVRLWSGRPIGSRASPTSPHRWTKGPWIAKSWLASLFFSRDAGAFKDRPTHLVGLLYSGKAASGTVNIVHILIRMVDKREPPVRGLCAVPCVFRTGREQCGRKEDIVAVSGHTRLITHTARAP